MKSTCLRCHNTVHRVRAFALAVTLAGVAGSVTAVHAQQPIQIFLSAVDSDAKPVVDLKAEEIDIQVDGAACPITRFEAVDWPTKLTVMVDNSPVFNDSLRQLREALRAFFSAVPPSMEVTLISTSPAPRFIYKAGTDRSKLVSSIDLLTPDTAAPRFIDALAEAAERAAKEKAGKEKNNFFPVFLIIGNNSVEGSSPRDYQINKLFKQTLESAATVHVVMMSNSSRQLDIGAGTNQIEIGLKLTQMTGGRYEAIAAQTRLTTLLPEYAKQIVRSQERQSNQYRITCQPPANAKPQRITAATRRDGISAALTFDGRVP
jgi:hypothetical protein